jgi:mRNA-degrading endonuclease RelE of RelBE toxin-antitoxin system
VEKPQEVEGLCIHKPCKKDKIPSQKASAKEAKNQLKKLAKNQEETILPGHPDVTAPVVASPRENKKRRKQRHRLFFRLRQSNISLIDFIR